MPLQPFPILEYDPDVSPIIRARDHIKPIDIAEACVLCFFRDASEKLLAAHPHREVFRLTSETLHEPLYEVEIHGKKVALIQAAVGAPHAAGHLEELFALGCKKFIACGGAGVLNRELAVGHLVVPISAVRDEGTSYHYAPPSREIAADPAVTAVIERTLQAKNVPYVMAKTWTTDAFYRETRGKFNQRKQEGCVTVEMECSAFFAVAQYLGVPFGQILYAGDNLDGEAWNSRQWHTRDDIRMGLLELAVEAALAL
ncbi:MAG: nucleoside phosphorylase [Defluviitaleaceae bacterium]|nr:nucleoside phosphorylase [Defluviitaleaceae bacterium]MCL2273497.1 nucleoside phosphorylase [Defluviitaleaceae bacterium]